MKFLKPIFLLFIIVLTTGLINISCGNVKNSIPRIEKSFSKINTTPGSRDVSLKINADKTWKMNVYFPKETHSNKILIIALHWVGGGDTYKEYSQCLAIPGLKKLNAIIISPDAESLLWTNKYNEEKILRLVELAKKYWNIDADKVMITGYSNGGIGSWYFAENHQDVFKAAIPMAGVYYAEKPIKIPLYVIHGEKDELFKLDRTRKFVNLAKKNGGNIKFVVVSNFSHHMACSYVPALKKAANWSIKALGLE